MKTCLEHNHEYPDNGFCCWCQWIDSLRSEAAAQPSPQAMTAPATGSECFALAALQAAAEIFEELDSANWPQSERDEFHGEPGRCPVDYQDAQAQVVAEIAKLSLPNATR